MIILINLINISHHAVYFKPLLFHVSGKTSKIFGKYWLNKLVHSGSTIMTALNLIRERIGEIFGPHMRTKDVSEIIINLKSNAQNKVSYSTRYFLCCRHITAAQTWCTCSCFDPSVKSTIFPKSLIKTRLHLFMIYTCILSSIF